jgi:alkanesulfonate monooxygenase SsuD/methylene tetrahydromethanopterin reductase-like flavin-dependent oxidoreductase (luciferase family)
MEQKALGVDRARSKEQWKAAVRTVVGMWEDEYYEEQSEFLEFPRRMVTPKPFQDPHPPCWVAASPSTPGSAALAGACGLGMLSLSILQPVEKLALQVAEYRQAVGTGTPLTRVVNNRVAAYTLVHCVESAKEIDRNRVWDGVAYWYRTLTAFTLQWEMPNLSEEERARAFPLQERARSADFDPHEFGDADMIIIGTPEECIQKLERYEAIGVDEVLCYVQFGGIPHEATMRSLELLGKEVIPALRRRDPGAASGV